MMKLRLVLINKNSCLLNKNPKIGENAVAAVTTLTQIHQIVNKIKHQKPKKSSHLLKTIKQRVHHFVGKMVKIEQTVRVQTENCKLVKISGQMKEKVS